jgi:hypothetical protein
MTVNLREAMVILYTSGVKNQESKRALLAEKPYPIGASREVPDAIVVTADG